MASNAYYSGSWTTIRLDDIRFIVAVNHQINSRKIKANRL